MSHHQNLKGKIQIVGIILLIVSAILYYSLRFFEVYIEGVNDYLYWCLFCAGVSALMYSIITKEGSLKNSVAGYGSILFGYISVLYFIDLIVDGWANTKDVYIIIGGFIICLLQTLFRHFRSRGAK